jgi:type IV pilus assembly protein PilB
LGRLASAPRMFAGHDQILFELLDARGAIEREQLDLAFEEHRASGKPFADVLLDLNLVTKPVLLAAVAEHVAATMVTDLPARLPAEALALLDGSIARNYGVAPLACDLTSVSLLAVDPFNSQLVGDLTFALGRDVQLVVADPERVASLIRQHYGEEESSLADVVGEMQTKLEETPHDAEVSDANLEKMAGQTPVIRFVNLVLSQAIRDQASDIHFEPFEHEFKIRYRIDGALYEMAPPPKALAMPIISRVKVLANLNIAERRVPQDGRIKLTLAGRAVDLRVSTLPTQFGESVVLRVLDQSAVQLDLAQLTMPASIEASVREIIQRPNGIVVVTGPTGSGKTTTLYSCLKELNSPDVKILTVEDPVEYEIDGIMQVPVNYAADLSFARALRAFLRQDPDVVMIGEVRDLETAQIAIQASLTGHLVLSTLHTNDAPGAVTRLIDMGIEPFLLASTLEAVLAQRLVRRLCSDCRQPYEPSDAVLRAAGISRRQLGGRPFYESKGCPACHHGGYRGRRGIFEMLKVNDPLRDLVVSGASLVQLRQQAIAHGMVPLREAGLQAILAGETSLEEVMKYM